MARRLQRGLLVMQPLFDLKGLAELETNVESDVTVQ